MWHVSCVQGRCGDAGVCGEVDQKGHDWSSDGRQTFWKRHYSTAEGMWKIIITVFFFKKRISNVYFWTLIPMLWILLLSLRNQRCHAATWQTQKTWFAVWKLIFEEQRLFLSLTVLWSFVFWKGGTGFAGSGIDLTAKEARPVMQAWGDRRLHSGAHCVTF